MARSFTTFSRWWFVPTKRHVVRFPVPPLPDAHSAIRLSPAEQSGPAPCLDRAISSLSRRNWLWPPGTRKFDPLVTSHELMLAAVLHLLQTACFPRCNLLLPILLPPDRCDVDLRLDDAPPPIRMRASWHDRTGDWLFNLRPFVGMPFFGGYHLCSQIGNFLVDIALGTLYSLLSEDHCEKYNSRVLGEAS